VSAPANPERRPSLPPSEQANLDLILKAISESQEPEIQQSNSSLVPQIQKILVPSRPQRITRSDSGAKQDPHITLPSPHN
jgi:hypothetical protein